MRKRCVILWVFTCLQATSACGGEDVVTALEASVPAPEPAPLADANSGDAVNIGAVEIGVPGGPDGLTFAALEKGAELRLQSFGQGGTHVLLAIRCTDFGNRAFIALTLTNLRTSAAVTSPAPFRPQLLYCSDERTCDLVPLLAMAGGLTAVGDERNGLPVRITVDVHNQHGRMGSGTQDVVLSTADL